MVLEEHIVLMRHAANTAEHIASHEVIGVGAKTIDNLKSHQLASAVAPFWGL